MNYRIKRVFDSVDKFLERAFPFAGKNMPTVFSFCLGMTTAFFLRDELNYPTFLRIKRAYLTNKE